MSTIVKSLESDFGGSWNQSQLHQEILGETGIATPLTGINHETSSDVISIVFNSSLSGSESTTLDNLIAIHVPDTSKKREIFFTVYPNKTSIRNSIYSKIATFKYLGSDEIGIIDYIDVISYQDSGITSYDIRILDETNGNIVAESTGLTNTVNAVNDLGTISNIPTDSAIFEVHIRKNGGNTNKHIYVEAIIVYYNNNSVY